MSKTVIRNGMYPPGIVERIVKGAILTVICASVIVPFIGIISTSLAPPDQINDSGGFVLFPTDIDWTAYKAIIGGGVVTKSVFVSLGVTAVGTTLSLVCTTLLAWALSRRGTVANRPMLLLLLFSVLFTPGLIPAYLVVQQFGLIDSLWSLIVPSMISAFNVIVIRSFFVALPAEIIDSARIDGAGDWQVFRYIALPLSRPILSVIGLFYGVSYWNAFFNALLYINDAAKWPLQLILRTYVVNGTQLGASDLGAAAESLPPQIAIQMAILVISIIPILIIYPFVQKSFSKGVLTGAVKG